MTFIFSLFLALTRDNLATVYFTKLQGRNTQFDVHVKYNYPLFFLYNMYSIDRTTSQEVHNTLPVINNKYAL